MEREEEILIITKFKDCKITRLENLDFINIAITSKQTFSRVVALPTP